MGDSALAEQAPGREEKIVLCYMINLQDLDLAKEWHKIRQLPFNGMMFRTLNVMKVMRPKEIPWSAWQQDVDELKSAEFGHFKENFLYMSFSGGHAGTHVDWFDDWTPVIKNIKNMARVAKLTGLKGFMWDPEGYHATPHFSYPRRGDTTSRTRAEYETRVRNLAEQVMTEIRKVYPDITILTLHGYSHGYNGLDLLPTFLDGLLAASDPRFVLVDGQEASYYDKDRADFARRYARMRHPEEIAFRLCGEKERWAKQGQAGFALFVTVEREGDWQSRPDLLDMNYFNPPDFRRALTNAANLSDRYVWTYAQHGGRWMSSKSDWYPYNMARVYMDIVSEVTGVPYKPTAEALAAIQKRADGVVPRRLDITRQPARVKPPTIDGDLSDSAWSKAVHIHAFIRSRSTAGLPETGVKTEAWVTYDPDNLYVAFRCHDPDMPSIKIVGGPKRDSNVFSGDSVELWLTPGPDVRPFYQFIINPDNFVFDRRNQKPEDFDGAWRSAVLKREKDWQVELAVPWSDLEIKAPKPGTTLRANLNRIRRGRPEEVRRWHAMGYGGMSGELSSWSQYKRSFTEIVNLGYWTFK